MYSVIELFSGAGGLALGLELSGFTPLCLVEKDIISCNTLKKNRPNWKIISKDIHDVDPQLLRSKLSLNCQELDLLAGGIPCQAFSYAGMKKGFQDPRGMLYQEFARFLSYFLPKIFLVENVKGLVTHNNGNTLKTMLNCFSKFGYNIQYKVLNALDYGVAQKRNRVVIVGIRNDLNISYHFPKKKEFHLSLKDILKNVPPSVGAKYPEKKIIYLKLVPPGGYWRDLPIDKAKEYMGKSYYSSGGRTGIARRLSWNEPSLTLTCSPSQKQTERCHPDETRPFTTREYARIQSFPDSWIFEGSISQIYKQIGNAVPVLFAKEIGLSIMNCLKEVTNNGK